MTSTSFDGSSGRNAPASFLHSRFLSVEEEGELTRQYREGHDPAIARRLVESHLGLVAKIARQSCSRKEMLPDLIQEGCMGLMRAVEKFDPSRGVRLASYAAWWIRAFIYQHIMANSRMMRIATTFPQRKLFFNLNRETLRLEREGKEALAKDIAERLGVTEAEVVEMRARLASREVDLEMTMAAESALPLLRLDDVSAPSRPDELVETDQLRDAVSRKVQEVAATLDVRDRAIFDERLMAEKPTTLNELGERFGVSRERARQLEVRLKTRLRPLFQEFRGFLGGGEPDSAAAAAA